MYFYLQRCMFLELDFSVCCHHLTSILQDLIQQLNSSCHQSIQCKALALQIPQKALLRIMRYQLSGCFRGQQFKTMDNIVQIHYHAKFSNPNPNNCGLSMSLTELLKQWLVASLHLFHIQETVRGKLTSQLMSLCAFFPSNSSYLIFAFLLLDYHIHHFSCLKNTNCANIQVTY